MGTKRKLPFGYKMESGRVVIDSVEKSWVLHLFSRYNMGISIRELTEFMNNTAVSYDLGKPWNKNMVARILADTRYLGDSGFPVLICSAMCPRQLPDRPAGYLRDPVHPERFGFRGLLQAHIPGNGRPVCPR